MGDIDKKTKNNKICFQSLTMKQKLNFEVFLSVNKRKEALNNTPKVFSSEACPRGVL